MAGRGRDEGNNKIGAMLRSHPEHDKFYDQMVTERIVMSSYAAERMAIGR